MIDKNNKGKYNNINIHNKNHNFKRRITTTFNVILILLFSFCELTIARLKFPLGLLPFSNPLKPKRKGAKNFLPPARGDKTKHKYNYVPEHPCIAPGYCGCKEMAGGECAEAIRGCCNSFCEPLCVEDMIGCEISGGASRLKGAGGKSLKDELCHVLVGAGCSNELPACSGKDVYVHYTDAANALGEIKKKAHTSQISDLNFEDEVEAGCSVTVTFFVKKHNPYPCTNGFKPAPKL